jgi:NADPH:quinone reductase-like Zn-dependent oxidoreductase
MQMRAAVVNVLSQPPQYQEFPEPNTGENEVLVRVSAAGLHPVVKARARGAHYSGAGEVPMIPGLDGIGYLDDGSRVYFAASRQKWGTMAERSVASRSMCVALPDGIDDLQAAAIVNPGMSALGSLKERARLAKGETVLILGATGVAGQLAIQVARYLGAGRVIAAGRNLEALSAASVDAVVPLAQPDEAVRDAFAAEASAGIDVVIDYLWGRPTELLLEALARGFRASSTRATRLVEVGESAGKTVSLPGATLRSIDLTLMGSGFGSVPLQTILDMIPALFSLAAEGQLQVAAEPVPLAEVEQAWNRPEKGRRIVFTL